MIGRTTIADNESSSLRKFRSPTSWALARNLQHYAAERGRQVICCSDISWRIDLVAGLSLEIPFDGTPHEALYGVQIEVGTRTLMDMPGVTVRWWVESDDTAGANPSAAQVTCRFTTAAIDGREAQDLLPGGIWVPLPWYDRPLMVRDLSEWHYHRVAAALPTTGRILRIRTACTLPVSYDPGVSEIYLEGVYAYGLREDAP